MRRNSQKTLLNIAETHRLEVAQNDEQRKLNVIANAAELEDRAVLRTDVCIIGGGTAGLVLAHDLADSGLDIIVLEAGGLKFSKRHQSLYAGESDSAIHAVPNLYRQRRFGGTSTIWGGRCVPFDAIDFSFRKYVPFSGWPFDGQHLQPFYERAQNYLHAGTFDYDARTALKIDKAYFIDGLSLSSNHIDSASLERFSLPTDLGKSLGPVLSLQRNVRVFTDATCLEIRADSAELPAHMAACRTFAGKFFSVISKIFVVAVGGLETVRLLGASSSHHHAGLGNHSDCLGRFYMCHIETAAGELQAHPRERKMQYGFVTTEEGVYVRRRLKVPEMVQSELELLNLVARPFHANVVDPAHKDPVLSAMFLSKRFLIPEYRRKFSMIERSVQGSRVGTNFWLAHMRNIMFDAPKLMRFAAQWVHTRHLSARRMPYVALPSFLGKYPLDINSEQIPNPESRVRLTDARDAFRLPKLRIEWKFTSTDIDSIVRSMFYLRDQLRATGCATVNLEHDFKDRVRDSVPVGGHHIGTARMCTNSKYGVVDVNALIYGSSNVYVAGSAIFPTCSHANPTLTLLATTIRLGDYIRRQLGGRPKLHPPRDLMASTE